MINIIINHLRTIIFAVYDFLADFHSYIHLLSCIWMYPAGSCRHYYTCQFREFFVLNQTALRWIQDLSTGRPCVLYSVGDMSGRHGLPWVCFSFALSGINSPPSVVDSVSFTRTRTLLETGWRSPVMIMPSSLCVTDDQRRVWPLLGFGGRARNACTDARITNKIVREDGYII